MAFNSVSQLGASPSGGATGLTDRKKDLGKDEFLKLMMAQMQHQDPLAPQDNTQMIAQMAQFSSLEQMMNLNKKFDNFVGILTLASNVQAVNYLGKEVRVNGDRINFDGKDDKVKIYWKTNKPADSTELIISDQNGKVVRKLKQDNLGSGDHSLEWDGRDQHGNKVKAGNYVVSVEATGAEGQSVSSSVIMRGKVDAVTFENGYPELTIAGRKFKLGDIKSIF